MHLSHSDNDPEPLQHSKHTSETYRRGFKVPPLEQEVNLLLPGHMTFLLATLLRTRSQWEQADPELSAILSPAACYHFQRFVFTNKCILLCV